ncbi:MAG: ABC transporter permease [Desulfatitalea sp.]|nr:ABC transporter permease [Desulfatitalea sp.]NNK00052.1 ABC transporter permease [Desulfatitalea sp.]
MSPSKLFFMRMRGMLRKEMLQIRRDPSSIALAVVLPMALLFLFGYGVSLDAENVPVAVVMDDNGPPARDLMARFLGSRYFHFRQAACVSEAQQWLAEGQVDGIVHLQDNLTARLAQGRPAQVQAIINGVDANRARLIQGYFQGLLQTWQSQRMMQGDAVARPMVGLAPRIWFNEAAVSRNFLVPGLITLIMTLIGILLTALVIAREWERGTMEALLATPLRRFDLLLAKVLPYFILGMAGMGLSLVVAVTLFGVPLRGSIVALFGLSAVFMLASQGFGLLISAAIRVQFVAAQISIMAGFLPAFFLSGLLFDLESTPLPIQMASHIVPARYFVAISHTLFMAGDLWPVLLPNTIILAGMATFFMVMAYRKISKRLE